MNSKTLLSLAGIVLAVGAALYNWKYGGTSPDSIPTLPSASTQTATREQPADVSGMQETAANPAAKGATGKSNASTSTAANPVGSPASSSSVSTSKPAITNATAASNDVAQANANSSTKPAPTKPASTETKPSAPAVSTSTVGFGSTRAFDEHFEKHGGEFGSVTQAQYLVLAQQLRDAPVGGSILEAVRDDGVISRFDKKSGAFLAFNKNKTIRTFFKPNDGVRYFERQIEKEH